MRTAFINTLERLADKHEDLTLMVGDLGFGVVDRFAENYPQQYLNAGVAEQNMTGMAAGMALTGKNVFTYSIGNFPTLRCLEQIRNDVCYHKARVKVVSVGGGYCYGALGATHHATEDLAVMRSLPNLTVVAPGDPAEARAATEAVAALNGPAYLRLGRAGEPEVHREEIDFQLGKAILTRDYGRDATLISTGGMLRTAVDVAERLAERGTLIRVLSMHTLKPLDELAILDAADETGAIITLEEHSINGGLGGAVAEVLAERKGNRAPLKRLGLPPYFTTEVGSQEHLLRHHGLDADSVTRAISLYMTSVGLTSSPANVETEAR